MCSTGIWPPVSNEIKRAPGMWSAAYLPCMKGCRLSSLPWMLLARQVHFRMVARICQPQIAHDKGYDKEWHEITGPQPASAFRVWIRLAWYNGCHGTLPLLFSVTKCHRYATDELKITRGNEGLSRNSGSHLSVRNVRVSVYAAESSSGVKRLSPMVPIS